MKKIVKRILVLAILGTIIVNAGCRERESNMFRSMVTRYRTPPKITVFIKQTGKTERMDIEEYLAGVVAGEMKPNWPLEAYAAQAIIARTFTMEFLSRGGTRKLHGTDISTDETEAQAYNAANITPVIRRAIRMTRGEVLTYKNRYVKAWYSASCGGLTTYAKEGLGYRGPEPPYISSVKSPEEEYMPAEEFYWNTTLTSKEINAALRKMNKPEIGEVKKMKIVERSRTHRAVTLKFIGDKGSVTVGGADFRVNYGPQKIRSIWISNEIDNRPGAIGIKGRGFGHGVGLSQWGAYALAKQNWSPRRIVKHFYPKAKITKIW
ncbi:MAG TPA: SpoIID/LytB domain-containing protein [Bacillota bacterium]|nr:SpoIID/LytB domain-containing protein [Bacillota bacterium]HOL10126.1 SpoIID/LytB domain-containing protein [Bacillota bacterium]HPO97878.1 SpoIID/LytB domain-containing protein [Bacillota bacterium]